MILLEISLGLIVFVSSCNYKESEGKNGPQGWSSFLFSFFIIWSVFGFEYINSLLKCFDFFFFSISVTMNRSIWCILIWKRLANYHCPAEIINHFSWFIYN